MAKAATARRQNESEIREMAALAQGAVTGASAADKTTAPQAKTTAQRPVVAPDKRAELEKKRADMQKRLRQQGKIKQ
jgi:hypothetical protein